MSLHSLPTLIPIGLAVGAISFALTPTTRVAGEERRRLADYVSVFRGPIRSLWAVMVLRSIAAAGYADMIAFVLTGRGEDAHIGPTLAAFNIAGAVGSIVGGRLSDRFGRMPVIRVALITSLPLIPLLVQTPTLSWWYYPLVVALGVAINAPLPISVAAAQEYAPQHVATASAMMMGFAWGMAGLLFPLIGMLADATTPEAAIQLSALVLLPAVAMAMRLPEPRP